MLACDNYLDVSRDVGIKYRSTSTHLASGAASSSFGGYSKWLHMDTQNSMKRQGGKGLRDRPYSTVGKDSDCIPDRLQY